MARVDVIAVHKGQDGSKDTRLPTPVVQLCITGTRNDGLEKGGDVAIYIRDSRNFTVLNFKLGVDDTAEICGVRLLGSLDMVHTSTSREHLPPAHPPG